MKVRLKFRDRKDLPTGEGLWARQLEGNSGGGTYELENSSYYVPLAVGDVVRAQLDPDGYLQVTGFVSAGQHVLTTVELDLARCDQDVVMARWADAGAVWSEGTDGVVLTIWTLDERQIAGILDADVAAGYARWTGTSAPEERGKRALRDVDLRIARQPEFHYVKTSYWAGDDPYWTARGLDSPEYLAIVQILAFEDRRVARALENGQQDRVVEYVERLTAPDPDDLPRLDGSLFDND
jgi:hypothetical protein